jgi:predicted kinase
MPPIDLLILIGIPGAGKTTFFRDRFEETHVHLSRDLPKGAAQGSAERRRKVERLLREGVSVAVDDTNVRRSDRAPLIAAARAARARVVGYFFDVTTRAAVARNAERKGRARVPNVAIFTAAKRLEPPALSEGFDELHVVRLTRGGRAVVDGEASGGPPGHDH